MPHQHSLSLPPALHGLEVGSPAEDCIRYRLPKIGRKIITDNDLPKNFEKDLNNLIAEIPASPITPIPEDGGPDTLSWNSALEPYLGKNWLEPPWFVVETYFYRRVIVAINYFTSQIDPFSMEKNEVLQKTWNEIQAMCQQQEKYLQTTWNFKTFETLLHFALWGNQVDLSLWTAEDRPRHIKNSPEDYLLVDDGKQIQEHFREGQSNNLQIDIIIDNAAFELVGDLLLADYLLSTSMASRVNLHLKLHPTFVSDATVKDVLQTIQFLETGGDSALQTLGERVANHVATGRLQCHTHPFWTSLHYMWHMPEELREKLASSHLVISKGDANYRRSLGDAHWSHVTPLTSIINYFPAPILFLRTCKSNLVAGLEAGQASDIMKRDPEWLTNGKWGLIQFITGECMR